MSSLIFAACVVALQCAGPGDSRELPSPEAGLDGAVAPDVEAGAPQGSIHPPAPVLQVVVEDRGTSYARLADGRTFRWGKVLSDESVPPTLSPALQPVEVPELYGLRQLALVAGRACAVTATQRVLCWGVDYAQRLLDTSPSQLAQRLVPTDVGLGDVTSVATTLETSCALHQNGKVSCWGNNNLMQAYPDLSSASEEGIFPPRIVPEIEGATAVGMRQQNAGFSAPASCALLSDRTVRCWGGPLRLDPSFTDYHPVAIPGFDEIVEFSAGQYLLAKHADGRVFRLTGWGWTAAPERTGIELRYADRENPAVGFAGVPGATAIVRGDGRIDFQQNYPGWSEEVEGRLTASVFEPVANAKALAMVSRHACLVDDAGVVQCVGLNDVGQLGDGTTQSRRTFAPVLWPEPVLGPSSPTH